MENLLFQFHTGSIKALNQLKELYVGLTKFQFHTGSIKAIMQIAFIFR